MFKRWAASVIAFLLVFALAMPVLAETPEEIAADNTNTEETQPVATTSESDVQALPLPESEVQQELPITNPGALVLQMGAIEGYTPSEGKFNFHYKTEDGVTHYDYPRYFFNGMIYLDYLKIPSNAVVTLSVTSLYTKLDFTGSLLYIDERTMTSEDLLSLGTWPIRPDAVKAPLDASSIPFSDIELEAPNGFATSYIRELSILTAEPELTLSIRGQKDYTGYLISKTFPIVPDATLVFDSSSMSTSSTIQVPFFCQSVTINGYDDFLNAGFNNISELVMSHDKYSLDCTETSTIEGGERNTSWVINGLDVKEDRKLRIGYPELDINYMDLSADRFWSDLDVFNGEFQLNSMTDFINGEYKDQIGTKVRIIDNKNKTVYESESDLDAYWGYLSHEIEPKLSSGVYTVEITVTIPGYAGPFQITKQINVYSPDDYTGKGLLVQAENEIGKPLQNMQVQLFEKRPPYIGSGDNDGTQYYSLPSYTSSSVSGDPLVIPNSVLVIGHSYDVVVTGTSSDGEHTIVYQQPVTRDLQNLQLQATNLKHVTVNANYASPEDTLLITMVDDNNNSSSWPFVSQFQNDHRTEWYIQTSGKLSVKANLYDAATDTGYLLSRSITLTNNANQTFDMDGATVQVQLPAGYDSAKLKVSSFDYTSKYEAKRYVVSQGMGVTASYYVESDGYRYSFSKGLGAVQGDISLRFGREFINRWSSNQLFAAGEVNKRVYTDYMDEQDNVLTDVTPLQIAKITDQVDSNMDAMTFTIGDEEHSSTMSVQSTDSGIAYTSIDPLGEGQSAGVNGSIIDYQMYNASNQPIGGKLGTVTPQEVRTDIPSLTGDYSLQITSQRFPDKLVKLSGQANLTAANTAYGQALAIPIEPPTGYTADDIDYGYSSLIPIDDPASPVYVWVSKNKLYFSDPSSIVANKVYALHLAVYLNTTNGTILYYNQVQLTGAQLLNLKQVKAPSKLVTVDITDKLPNNFELYNLRLQMPTINHPDALFDTYIGGNYVNGNQTSLLKIMMQPQTFQVVEEGRNQGSTLYYLKKQVQVNASGTTTLTDLSNHRVQLQNKTPFLAFQPMIPNSYSYSYGWSIYQLYNEAYVSPGHYQFMFLTSTSVQGEAPWNLRWVTNNSYNMDEDTIIPFTGKVEASQSTLNLAQQTDDGKTTLSIKPELISGGLRLQAVETTYSNYYSYSIPAIITITDSSQKKIYEAVSYEYGKSDANYEITKTLADGTYTLTYRQPVGPNDEVVLSKTFTVAAASGGEQTPGGGGVTPGGGTTVGGGGGGVPASSQETDEDNSNGSETESPKSTTFKSGDIPAAVSGTVTLPINGSETINIAATVLTGDDPNNKLVLSGNHTTITLPPEVLKQLAGLVGTDELADAHISLSFTPVSESQVTEAIQSSSGSEVKPAGTVYDFKLTITAKDGTPITLSKFDAPITVAFEVDSDAEKSLTNVYYIADDGTLTYVPGHWENGKLVAQISHFSQYGVLEVHRSFADISASHWAHDAIEQLAARQIVQGVSADEFAPNRKITRAEFTAMIVNTLGLTAAQSAPFSDVPSTAWYAEAVAAAYENNLIKGISDDQFAPNKSISREEMAVIIVNALKLKEAAVQTDAKPVSFNDSSTISNWASEAVNTASANGLINGNGTGGFNPRGMTTRAEAAQVLMKLISLLEQ